MSNTGNKLLAIAVTAINQQISGTDWQLGVTTNGKILLQKYAGIIDGSVTFRDDCEFDSLNEAVECLSGWDAVCIAAQMSDEISFPSQSSQQFYC